MRLEALKGFEPQAVRLRDRLLARGAELTQASEYEILCASCGRDPAGFSNKFAVTLDAHTSPRDALAALYQSLRGTMLVEATSTTWWLTRP